MATVDVGKTPSALRLAAFWIAGAYLFLAPVTTPTGSTSTGSTSRGESAGPTSGRHKGVELGATVGRHRLPSLIPNRPFVFTVRLWNDGPADLQVDAVQQSCSCTVAGVPPETIPAGHETSVTLTIDPPVESGVTVSNTTFLFREADQSNTSVRPFRFSLEYRVDPNVTQDIPPEARECLVKL